MISKIFSLRNYVMKQIMKPNKQGIMQIPAKGKVDFGEMIIKEQLFKKGIDPKAIISEKQLDNILNAPNVAPKVMPKKSGEVINVDFDKGRWKDTDPENLAQGGRTGTGLNYLLGEDDQNVRVPFKVGGFNKARRAFLQVMGAGAAGTAAAKSGLFSLLKAGKPITGAITSVPIGNAPGMPAWFKPLVNKVIKEGDDVTKQFATKEREIVHTKKLDDVDEVTVTQDLDTGSVRVDYQGKGSLGDGPIQLVYKKGEEIPTKKGSVKEKDSFTASEEDFYPQATSPDGDFDIEFTENIVNKVDDLYSDTSKLKEFATGKNLTIKEISESMKKRNYLKEIDKNPNDHAFRNVPDPDWDDYLPDDYASGGRVPLAEGKKALTKEQLEEMLKVEPPKHYKESPLAIPDDWLKRLKEKFNKADGGRVPLAGGKLAQTLIQQIIKKYKGRIDDKLLKQMLVDDNPQRLAEVMATVDEALIMQGKGIGPETIMQTMRESWKRKKQASGGLAGMLGE